VPVTIAPSCRSSRAELLRALSSSSTASFARHHHVSAPAVEFQNADGDVLPHHVIEVVGGADIDLGTGHESGDADVHGESTFGSAGDTAGDEQVLAVCFFERLPRVEAHSAFVGKEDIAAGLRLVALYDDIDRVAGLNGYGPIGQLELLNGNRALPSCSRRRRSPLSA
jgi:hypothetical protein